MFEKTMRGTEIIKTGSNKDYEVALTRRTTKNGTIRHAVVITKNGIRTLVKSYTTLAPAFNLYKAILNA